jgi:hypothetical protein
LQAANGQQLRDRGGRKALQASTFAQRQLCKIREQVRLGVALDNATSGVFVRFEVLGFAGVAVRWVEALQSVSGKGEAAALDLLRARSVSSVRASLALERRSTHYAGSRSHQGRTPMQERGGDLSRSRDHPRTLSQTTSQLEKCPESAVCLDRATSSAARLIIRRARGTGASALVKVGAASSTEGGGRA